eukprot:6427096-Amphidinium_carterae.1
MKKLSDHHLQELEECGFPHQVAQVGDVPNYECSPEEVIDEGDHPEAGLPDVDDSTLTPDVWCQGEWDLPLQYQTAVDRFTLTSHLTDVGMPVSNGKPTPLTSIEEDELQRHIQGGHLTKSLLCRACVLGSGPLKYHMKLHPDDRMTHCLHVDLAGPFAQSVDCFTYFMVGVLRLPDFPLLFQ